MSDVGCIDKNLKEPFINSEWVQNNKYLFCKKYEGLNVPKTYELNVYKVKNILWY